MENSSVGERVWNAAEQAGAERRKKIDTTINRVLGLPEAAAKLTEIGSEAVKAKAEEIKNKAIDLKERTELKITETKEKLVNRYETAKDNLFSRVEAFKEKVKNKATELKNRAVKAGLETGLKIEDKIVAICELPADLKEAMAGRLSKKAESAEATKSETLAQQFAEKNELNATQLAALKEFLQSQLEQTQMVEAEHEEVRKTMDKTIESAKGKALEHRQGAEKVRSAVEKRRVFKGLLEGVK
jgi:hypothetical protein